MEAFKPPPKYTTYENIWQANKHFFQQFLSNYHKEFTSKDFNYLIFLGPVISLILRTVKDFE